MRRFVFAGAALWCLLSPLAQGADLRERMRTQADGIKVSGTQASDLTLTLTEVAMRPIQTWIRTVGTIAPDGQSISAQLRASEAEGVQIGQRTRNFAANARTRMHQGKVIKVAPQAGGPLVLSTLADRGHTPGTRYLMEIVVERGPHLSIPNVSIIEEGGNQLAYIEMQPAGSGIYAPRVIQTGVQGEQYTEVKQGLFEGDRVVSIGSFFVNAEDKLKMPRQGICTTIGPSNERHHH